MPLSEQEYKTVVISFMIFLILFIILEILNCIYYIIADNYVNGNKLSNVFSFRKPRHSCGCNRRVKFML